ncbi:hypothetical protein WEI85_04905 [Actinomycetes bacterium KLBMP 9797]
MALIKVNFQGYGTGEILHPDLAEEITRLMWLSRLNPLECFWLADGSSSWKTVWLFGTDGEELRHRYGPRPYGPYQED